jgi:hypothetical protein
MWGPARFGSGALRVKYRKRQRTGRIGSVWRLGGATDGRTVAILPPISGGTRD